MVSYNNDQIYPVIIWFAQMQLILEHLRCTSTKHIENMIIPFLGTLTAYSALLQQIMRNMPTDHLTFGVIMYLPHAIIFLSKLLSIKPSVAMHLWGLRRGTELTSINFPNRELLLLRVVFALPNASNIGLASNILRSIGPAAAIEWHKYFNKYLVDSVLPAPDSPDTIIDWDIFRTRISRMALSAEWSHHSERENNNNNINE